MPGVPLDEVQQIWLVLIVLYVVECAWWLRGDARRLYTGGLTGWSDRPEDATLRDAWRLGFAAPLPWSESFAAQAWPFPCDAERLLVPTLDAATGTTGWDVVPFTAFARATSREREVLLDDRVVGRFWSADFAALAAARLEAIRAASPARRPAAIDALVSDLYDLPGAGERLAALRRALAPLNAAAGWLTLVGLGAAPLAWTFRRSLPSPVPATLAALAVGLWLVAAVAALLLPRGRLPAEAGRLGHRLLALLSPATAMRMPDTLSRDALVAHEPLVVALVTRGRRAELPAAYLRDILHAPQPPGPADVAATLDRFRERVRPAAEAAVRAAGCDPTALVAAPAPQPDARGWCPRCARQYVQPQGTCAGCGVAIQPLPAAAADGC